MLPPGYVKVSCSELWNDSAYVANVGEFVLLCFTLLLGFKFLTVSASLLSCFVSEFYGCIIKTNLFR